MIITVLGQKYKCGCNRGMTALEKPSLLPKLNSIIEWDLCEFPTKLEEKEIVTSSDGGKDDIKTKSMVEVEDRNFLGDDPELKPGNCFLFEGQVIAVDSNDRLVLLVSETGHGALDRIYEETIKPEIELTFNGFEDTNAKWEVPNDSTDFLKQFDGEYKVPYHLYKIFKDHFVEGRGFLKTGMVIKATMESDNFVFPIDFCLTDWKIKYKTSQLEEDEIESAVIELLSWFYSNYPRISAPKKKSETPENLNSVENI